MAGKKKKADKTKPCIKCEAREKRAIRGDMEAPNIFFIFKNVETTNHDISRMIGIVVGYEQALVTVNALKKAAGMDRHMSRGDEDSTMVVTYGMEPVEIKGDIDDLLLTDGRW